MASTNNSVKSLTSLSPGKRKLLNALLEKKGIRSLPRRTIPRRKTSDAAIASFLQEGLWFLDRFDPGKPTYNVPGATRLRGPLDLPALEKTLSEIIRRHEALRTTFVEKNGKPYQVIAPSKPIQLSVINLEDLPETEREAEVQRLATEEARKPFDLSKGPLCRFFLMRLKTEEHVLVLNIHHIVTDGWSMGVFTRELVALYTAFSPPSIPPQGGNTRVSSLRGAEGVLKDLPIQFADFAIWQREWLQGEVLKEQLSYWKQQLSGRLPVLELPTDRPRPQFQSCQGGHQTLTLSASLSDALRMLTQREDFTLFETLLTAFKIFLYHYSGQEDIIVGSPVANRNRRELEDLIGYFVNMLPLRTDLSGNPTFQELLNRVHKTTMSAYAHQDLPFGKLVEQLRLERDPSRNPVFQVEFILLCYEHAPAVYGYGFRSPIKEPLKLSELTLTPVEVESGIAKFDLVVLLWDMPEGISGTFEYNADLFDAATITGMIKLYETLLTNIIARPDAKIQVLKNMLADKNVRAQNTKQQQLKSANFEKLKNTRRKAAIAIETED